MSSKTVLWLIGVSAVAAILLSLIPFQVARPLADNLTADGEAWSLTLEKYGVLMWILRSAAGGALVATYLCVRFSGAVVHVLALKEVGWGRPLKDLRRETWQALLPKLSRWEWMVAVLILGAGMLLRVAMLSQPMRIDEAYTYLSFVSQPVVTIISDYHLPNNHILHSLLGHASTACFGAEEWAIRLPAFLAGVLSIVAASLAAGRLFGRGEALATGLLVGLNPYLIDWAANARGYTLLMLFSLIILALFAQRDLNWVGWCLAAVCASLGFAAIPTMLFPMISLGVFLVADRIMDRRFGKGFGMHILLFVGCVALLSLIAWFPVILKDGLKAIVGNSFVRPLSGDQALSQLLGLAKTEWYRWHTGLAPWGRAMLWLGLFTALLPGDTCSRKAWLLLATFVIPGLGMAAARHLAPPPRTWSYMAPIYLMLVATGGMRVVRAAARIPWKPSTLIAQLTLGLLLTTALGIGTASLIKAAYASTRYEGELKRFASELQGTLRPGDRVLMRGSSWPQVVYYGRRLGLSMDYFFGPVEKADHVLVLVVPKIAKEQMDDFDQDLGDLAKWSKASLLRSGTHIEIYERWRERQD